MNRFNSLQQLSTSRGAVLLLTMVFMVLIAALAATLMQTNMLQFRMAGNNQFREEAFQQAQAIASAISSDIDNFPVTGDVGWTNCAVGDAGGDCDASGIVLPAAVTAAPDGVAVDFEVVREGPLLLDGLPFRQAESNVSSSLAYDSTLFEVVAEVDGADARLGSAEVAVGIVRLVVGASQ